MRNRNPLQGVEVEVAGRLSLPLVAVFRYLWVLAGDGAAFDFGFGFAQKGEEGSKTKTVLWVLRRPAGTSEAVGLLEVEKAAAAADADAVVVAPTQTQAVAQHTRHTAAGHGADTSVLVGTWAAASVLGAGAGVGADTDRDAHMGDNLHVCGRTTRGRVRLGMMIAG